MGRGSVVLLVLLMLAGAVLSGLLVLQHHGEPLGAAGEAICDAASGGCDEVARSDYATIQGLSVAALGLFFYLSLLLLFVLSSMAGEATRRAGGALGLVAVALALIVDVMLLGVQAFVIGAFCTLCVLTYVINAAALFLLWSSRGAVGAIFEALGRGEGRLALAGWVLGSLAVAAAVLVGEVALGQRADARQAAILGAPIPPSSAPAASAPAAAEVGDDDATRDEAAEGEPPLAPEDEAEQAAEEAGLASEAGGDAEGLRAQLVSARREARRLQEILDDPRKLAAYQDQKAAADFEAAEREKLDLSNAPSKGPGSAPVTVVEYSDFLCPFCKNLAEGLGGYLPQSQGRVRLFFKHYPLDKACNPELNNSLHPGACRLALGGVCAAEQDAFWPYHDAVFAATPKDPSEDLVVGLATDAGLDGAAFRKCLSTPGAQARLQADIAEARRLGITGTPTLYINGKKLPRVADFLRAVESEAQAAAGTPAGQ